MPIYTRRGDGGWSTTLAGDRVLKNHPVLEACGDLDELNAALGLVRTRPVEKARWPRLAETLLAVQKDLLALGAYVSSGDRMHLEPLAFQPQDFEALIDELLAGRRLSGFVLPGHSGPEAALHMARAVCRRCERRLAAVIRTRPDARVRKYLNRLSDLLFALAVWVSD
jgi:cob(I)alamin adenosyltransferase